jgi:hypothetical protein
MEHKRTISILVLFIVVLSLAATTAGIFSNQGPGPFEHETVRGRTVVIYGKGIYRHMSMDVAPQGIAQDVVTLGIGIPILVISLYLSGKGLFKGRILLAGTLGYFLVTYLFYMIMGMYNEFFLVYAALTSLCFFAFLPVVFSLNINSVSSYFSDRLPVRFLGGFLLFNSLAIAALWLGVVVPPLLKGTIPVEVEHYTTLVVQGMDLSILLPAAFVSGVLLIKRRPFGYMLAPVYMVFLSILMTALVAKMIGMSMVGVNVGPPLVIIPIIALMSIFCAGLILKNVKEPGR